MKLKRIGDLKELFKNEGWDRLAFWPDGSWAEVGTGYAGDQDGNNPSHYLSRNFFYDTTEKERRRMVKAIKMAVEDGQMPILTAYDILG
jgi:hypothetical protein